MQLCRLFVQEFDEYCVMVDKARKVDVEGSMSSKKWSTDEFQHVLAIYSEQVFKSLKITVFDVISALVRLKSYETN